ncbi:MAG: hypothetical protein GMKNLPBB_01169 [Myxococcota bacterium]|nr:hypothetical protein [Myxococcota bacterium]
MADVTKVFPSGGRHQILPVLVLLLMWTPAAAPAQDKPAPAKKSGVKAGSAENPGKDPLFFMGFKNEARIRTEPSKPEKEDTIENDFRPKIGLNLKAGPHLFGLVYNPRLITPFSGDKGNPPRDYVLTNRGEAKIRLRPVNTFRIELKQQVDVGARDFKNPAPALDPDELAAPGGEDEESAAGAAEEGGGEELGEDGVSGDDTPPDDLAADPAVDALPEIDTVLILDAITKAKLELEPSKNNKLSLMLEFARRGGMGSLPDGTDSNNLVPLVLSPAARLEGLFMFTKMHGLRAGAQAGLNTVDYGSGLDEGEEEIEGFGGPSSWVTRADASYVLKPFAKNTIELGGGASLYSTPPKAFDEEDEVLENQTLFIPVALALWKGQAGPSKHHVKYKLQGNLLPFFNRVAGDVLPRLSGALELKYLTPIGLFLKGAASLAADLGDGQDLGGETSNGYLEPKGHQRMLSGGVGYEYQRWFSIELGMRQLYRRPRQKGDKEPRINERLNFFTVLTFNWDVAR